jgi:hypothetical protein
MVPDSVSVISKIERIKMADNFKKGQNTYQSDGMHYSFDTVDIKNGYLRISGTFEGLWEISYWKKSNGNKLIGISNITCGPVCGSRITFYDYSGNKLSPLSKDSILPKIENSDYYDVPKILSNNSSADFGKLQKEFKVALTYRLPQKGLNIIVKFELIDDIDTKKYKIYYKSNYDNLELLWNDGHFIKGKYLK